MQIPWSILTWVYLRDDALLRENAINTSCFPAETKQRKPHNNCCCLASQRGTMPLNQLPRQLCIITSQVPFWRKEQMTVKKMWERRKRKQWWKIKSSCKDRTTHTVMLVVGKEGRVWVMDRSSEAIILSLPTYLHFLATSEGKAQCPSGHMSLGHASLCLDSGLELLHLSTGLRIKLISNNYTSVLGNITWLSWFSETAQRVLADAGR